MCCLTAVREDISGQQVAQPSRGSLPVFCGHSFNSSTPMQNKVLVGYAVFSLFVIMSKLRVLFITLVPFVQFLFKLVPHNNHQTVHVLNENWD